MTSCRHDSLFTLLDNISVKIFAQDQEAAQGNGRLEAAQSELISRLYGNLF